VNFLYVLSLYARNNAAQKSAWKTKIRLRFRSEIQDWLQQDYDFYAMKARQGVNAKEYFKAHFQEVLGKTYTPYAHNGIYSLALEKSDPDHTNEALIASLRRYFIVEPCKLGDDPAPIITAAQSRDTAIPVIGNKDGVLMVMMMNYDVRSKNFVTGKLANPIKFTDSDKIILDNKEKISYILFHTRNKDNNKHLFRIQGSARLLSNAAAQQEGYYLISKDYDGYLCVEIDQKNELDSSSLNPSNENENIKVKDKSMRYDAQYVEMKDLKR
ncbi:MAG: restriction endonuclease, partial [Bacteroidales bacterium]|nr:restriction endonuclease [Bacteroidales bacterium]